jgi:type I restriction enzyme S subunit
MKQGWEIKKLGDVCDKASSNVSQNQLDNEIGKYPIFGASGLIKNVSFYHQSKPYLSIVKDGSGVGRITKMDAYSSVIGTLQYILPNEGIDLDYLNYSLMSIDFKKYVAGAAIPHIYFKDYKNEPFLWMPLSEQQQIVSVLNEAFAAIAKAKANAELNLKNAKELFESYLQGVFENSDWEMKTLGEIGDPKMCKRILKHQTNTTGEIPFYKIGTFGKTPDAFISKEIYDEYRTKYSFPKKGDILISASGTIGRRVRYDGEPAFFQDSNIVWIDNNEKQVLNDYLYVFYEFCDWQPSKGATISRLYNSNLTSIKIIFPKSLEEQKTILKKINAVSAETKKLESIYQQKINDLEELKKSVLQKAFSGELKTATAVV